MSLELGECNQQVGQRDAVHVAIASVQAAGVLKPGQRIGFLSGSDHRVDSADNIRVKKTIGIVDPFLQNDVTQWQVFIMILDPGSVTDLRHHWSHPSFSDDSDSSGDYDDSCRGC
jgi:cold shock CspA family protein